MRNSEIVAVQNYLRALFGNERISLAKGRADEQVEVYMGKEFIGTIYRDEDEGEVSYSFNMSILDIDLPKVD